MCDFITKMRRLRAGTGLSIADCKEYLNSLGEGETIDSAIQTLQHWQNQAKRNAQLYAQAQNSIGSDWWIRDYLCRSTQDLCLSNDPEVKRWGKIRKKQENRFFHLFNSKHEKLKELRDRREDSLDMATTVFRLRRLAWNAASTTSKVPQFQEYWLQELKVDPFAKLRPLMDPSVSGKSLGKLLHYETSASDPDRYEYVAAALRQAEQYWKASRAVDLTTKPVLLYYMTTCLLRAVLTTRIKDFIGVFGSHGLAPPNVTNHTLAGVFVSPTSTANGLFHAIEKGLPGDNAATGKDWSLLELCRYIPELSSPLDECHFGGSYASPYLDYEKLIDKGFSRRGCNHIGPVLSRSFLERCGIVNQRAADPKSLVHDILGLFPDSVWSCGEPIAGEMVDWHFSSELGTFIVALVLTAKQKYDQYRVFPLLYEGGLDGRWYVVFNNKKRRPHQFSVFTALLYGLSMLARYKTVDWNSMLSAGDGSATLLEEACRIAETKLPILATEWLTSTRILGSREEIPK